MTRRCRFTLVAGMVLGGCGGMTITGLLPAQGTPQVMEQDTRDPNRTGTPPNDSGKESLTNLVSLDFKDVPLKTVLEEINKQAGLSLFYSARVVSVDKKVSIQAKNITAHEALQRVLAGMQVSVKRSSAGALTLVRDTTVEKSDAVQGRGSIHGIVIDSMTRHGIGGATVILVSSRFSAITAEGGRFRIDDIPFGTYTVSIRLLGYKTKTIDINLDKNAARVQVQLTPASTTLTEVVTTATGLQRRVEVGHDIATINADSLLNVAPIRTVSDLLAVARVPGVTVEPTSGTPGAPSRIRVRGIGSINGDNDPVVFVDGVRISANASGDRMKSEVNSGTIVTSRLDDIDPETIETIEVLRGPSASALYGSDAANGIIVITTKKGKTGPMRLNLMASHDWNELARPGPGVYTGRGRSNTSDAPVACTIADVIAGYCVQDSVSVFRPDSDPLFVSEAPGATTKYSARLDGGVQMFRYSVSASAEDQLGPQKMRAIDAIRFRRVNLDVPRWLERPVNLSKTGLTTNITMDAANGFDIGINAQFLQQGRENNRGSMGSLAPENRDTNSRSGFDITRYNEAVSRVVIGVQSNWHRLQWLTASVNGGIDRNLRIESRSNDRYTVLNPCDPYCLNPSRSRSEGRLVETITSFNARGGLSGIGGASIRRWIRIVPTFGLNVRQSNQDRVLIRVDSLAAAGDNSGFLWSGAGKSQGDSARSASAGAYVDFQIGLFQRIYTSVGLRRDVGSTFGKRSGIQNYPKFNTSWLVSDEPFFPEGTFVNTLRLRFAAGISGIEPVLGAVDGGYRRVESVVNGQSAPSIQPTIIGNPQLRPERGVEVEYGLDMEAFQQRVALSLTVAEKNSRNVITTQYLPLSVLGNMMTRYDNIGHVVNRTIETSLDSRIIDRAGFLWTLRAGASTRINRVVKVGASADAFSLSSQIRIVEGYPIEGRWHRPVIGYYDLDGDGLLSKSEIVRSDSMVYAGWAQPKYSISYGTSISMLGRRVTITSDLAQDVGFTQSIARSIYGKAGYEKNGPGLQDVHASLDAQAIALGCVISQSTCAGGGATNQTVSMLRWNAASVSIDMPQRIARSFRARTLALQMSGRNLGLWTQYRGRDPSVNAEVGEARTDPGDLIPPPRTFSITARLGF